MIYKCSQKKTNIGGGSNLASSILSVYDNISDVGCDGERVDIKDLLDRTDELVHVLNLNTIHNLNENQSFL